MLLICILEYIYIIYLQYCIVFNGFVSVQHIVYLYKINPFC